MVFGVIEVKRRVRADSGGKSKGLRGETSISFSRGLREIFIAKYFQQTNTSLQKIVELTFNPISM
jgi:hypothetical protein